MVHFAEETESHWNMKCLVQNLQLLIYGTGIWIQAITFPNNKDLQSIAKHFRVAANQGDYQISHFTEEEIESLGDLPKATRS